MVRIYGIRNCDSKADMLPVSFDPVTCGGFIK